MNADGIDMSKYDLLDFTYKVGYWNPNSAKNNDKVITTSLDGVTGPKYVAIDTRFTSETLPVGTIIIVDDGYVGRFRHWTQIEPHETSVISIVNRYRVDTYHWDTEIYRALQIRNDATTALTDNPAFHISHMRIYIPKA